MEADSYSSARVLAMVILLASVGAAATEYGDGWSRTCDDAGRCNLNIGVATFKTDAGEYLPYDKAVVFTFTDTKTFLLKTPDFWVSIEPVLRVDAKDYTLDAASKSADSVSSIKATAEIAVDASKTKYGVVLKDVSLETALKMESFTWNIKSDGKVTVKADTVNNRFIIDDQIILDFNDLIAGGYTIKTTDTAVEVTGVANKPELTLDPTVSCSGANILDDANVYSLDADTNYGTATSMTSGVVAVSTPNWRKRMLIKYDLDAAIPSNSYAVVTNVVVGVYGSRSPSATASSYYLYSVPSQTWSEETVTWNNQPTSATNLQTASASAANPQWLTFANSSALCAFVQSTIRNSSMKNLSFSVIYSSEGGALARYFVATTKEVGSSYELLNITYYTNTSGSTIANQSRTAAIIPLNAYENITVDVYDADTVSAVKVQIKNTSGTNKNYTMTHYSSGNRWYYNYLAAVAGNYNITHFYANDTLGYKTDAAGTLTFSASRPQWKTPTPANYNTTTKNWVYLNISVNWTGGASACRIDWNGTSNTTMNKVSTTYFRLNKTETVAGNYSYTAWCNNLSVWTPTDPHKHIVFSGPPPDTAPPTLYNFNPSNSGTTTTSNPAQLYSFNTNEPANCSYNMTGDTTYGKMTHMTTTDGTAHSQTVDLIMGTNIIHFRCRDAAGNNNTISQNVTVFRENTAGGGGGGGGVIIITSPLNVTITRIDNIIVSPIWAEWHYSTVSSRAVTCSCKIFGCSSVGYVVTVSHQIQASNQIFYNLTDTCTLKDSGGNGVLLPVNLNVLNLAAYYPTNLNGTADPGNVIFAGDSNHRIQGIYYGIIGVFFMGVIYAYRSYA
jgi:hypothetical protein